jgi:5-methylcytosine-specific restriction endonuclease McrA
MSAKSEQNMARNPRSGSVWRRVRAEIVAEATYCGICRKPLCPERKPPDPLSTSVDHIIPLTCNGSLLDKNNLGATHLRCNQSRGKGRRRKKHTRPQSTRPANIPKTRKTSQDW